MFRPQCVLRATPLPANAATQPMFGRFRTRPLPADRQAADPSPVTSPRPAACLLPNCHRPLCNRTAPHRPQNRRSPAPRRALPESRSAPPARPAIIPRSLQKTYAKSLQESVYKIFHPGESPCPLAHTYGLQGCSTPSQAFPALLPRAHAHALTSLAHSLLRSFPPARLSSTPVEESPLGAPLDVVLLGKLSVRCLPPHFHCPKTIACRLLLLLAPHSLPPGA